MAIPVLQNPAQLLSLLHEIGHRNNPGMLVATNFWQLDSTTKFYPKFFTLAIISTNALTLYSYSFRSAKHLHSNVYRKFSYVLLNTLLYIQPLGFYPRQLLLFGLPVGLSPMA